ncbi:DUF2723 domain-containing protein [Bernardetia sp. Wsw4-3y2]|uniref:protein O-mannosyl-transferase family n=1 Tax=Bernardetia sp. Wsw4-3y2 TaxID=3127471 RepID=UPI0030D09191
MGFNRLNTIVGWLIFLIATTVYILTLENTASFWDCGEFIAVSYKLMAPHPPGAPFFLLVGRIFSLFAFGDVLEVAYWINMLSALCSSFSILFLFWTITMLARRIVRPTLQKVMDAKTETDLKKGLDAQENDYTLAEKIMILGSGAIGALAYTFSDSFWFSAAEAEVYGMSSFFTAIVVWAIFKWERIDDERDSNRWLIFIAYLVGLSIGVHLLNLLALPALAYVYYFKKYKTESTLGWIMTFLAGTGIVVLITYGVIPGLPSIAAKFEVAFVNTFGLPFGSGALFFTIAFIAALVWGIFYSIKKQNVPLNTALLSFAFIMIGYSTYSLIVIRSNADTPINENSPKDVMTFVSYLKREQYGDRPLVYGRTFASERTGQDIGAAMYRKGEEKYEVFDHKFEVTYDNKGNMLMPRIYSQSGNHPELYKQWLKLADGERPNFADNINFLFTYQFGHMYFRYFMWNFAGRQSDDKEAGWLAPFEDLGKELPVDLATNKARDNFYMLPLILGILGFIFQASKDQKGWWITFLIFFIMGIGLVLYLNSPPVEPRERDYVYVGSFYAFSVWIGLGMLAIANFLKKHISGMAASSVALVIALVVPTIMGAKGWDNHNRTGRYLSVDQARNTLAACEPNAILFTGGDNDTFPLWYVQDVEGFRTDVRVAVLSYFSTDWYADQMTTQVNDSPPLPISLEREDYVQGKNDYIVYVGNRDGSEDKNINSPVNLETYIDLLKKEDPRVMVQLQDGSSTGKLLSKKFALAINKQDVLSKGFIPKGKENRVVDIMEFDIKGNNIYKNDLLLLDLIATNKWERPIYFNQTSANTINFNLREYLQMDGMVYRLMPIAAQNNGDLGEVNFEEMKKAVDEFQFRGMQTEGYYDDEYKKFGAQFRQVYFRLAQEYFERGDKEKAIETLDKAFEQLPVMNVPYSYYEPYFVQLYHLAEADDKALALAEDISSRAMGNLNFVYKNNLNQFNYSDIIQRSSIQMRVLMSVYRQLDAMTTQEIQRLEAKKSMMQEENKVIVDDDGNQVQIEFSDSDQARLDSLKKRQKIFTDAIQKYSAAGGMQ